jgi:CRP-like cAMP-binding protein
MADLVDKNILKAFVPASALNTENFQELAGKTFVENVAAGQAIFKEGDNDRKSVYLVDGAVDIVSASGESKTIMAGSDMAKHALANQQPRKATATASVDSQVVRIDSDLLDILLTWDQLSGIEVDEIQVDDGTDDDEDDDDSDWMTRILQSKAFLQVPPGNIQAMFMRMQDIPVKAGDVIIKQGDDGDYYYIIKHGKCKVTRTSKTGSELTLATLGDGDAFGEEALLSEAKRNANIVMTTDGALVRLSKEDFNELLKEPMLSWVTNEEADAMVKEGNTVWIDVRLESEHKNSGIEGSVNIPLFMLRLKAQTLDPEKKYILYCDSGRRSSACAFLLSERGLDVYCLKGGLVERTGT